MILLFILTCLSAFFRSRYNLALEILALRQLFLANSQFAVIFIHASGTNYRNPSIFPIFKRGNQIETGLVKGESENRQSDALRHCSILFAFLTLTNWQSFMPLLAF